MAPQYKLYYFNLTGRAEPIRYIFAYAGQDYEDKRLKREQWPELKPNTQWGKMPFLEVDGKQVSQSIAISRYLAKQFGLLGQNDWESVKADELIDTLSDYSSTSFKLMMEKDPEKIEGIKAEKAAYLEKFEKIVDSPSGFLIGSKITWADLYFAASLSISKERNPENLQSYPKLVAFIDKINNLPEIKAWIARRPKSDPMPGPPGKK